MSTPASLYVRLSLSFALFLVDTDSTRRLWFVVLCLSSWDPLKTLSNAQFIRVDRWIGVGFWSDGGLIRPATHRDNSVFAPKAVVGMAVVKELTTKNIYAMRSFSEWSESSEVGKAKPLFKSVFVLLLGRRRRITFLFLGWAGLTCKPCFIY